MTNIDDDHIRVCILIVSIILSFFIGMVLGYTTCLKEIPDMHCDCGQLIMRQEIKGWDGYIDVPYDLNKFKNYNNIYEETMIWNGWDTE